MPKKNYLQDPATGRLAGSTAGATKTPAVRGAAPVAYRPAASATSPRAVRPLAEREWRLGSGRLIAGATMSQQSVEDRVGHICRTSRSSRSARAVAVGPFLLLLGSKRPAAGGRLDREQQVHLLANAFPYGAHAVGVGSMLILRRVPEHRRVAEKRRFTPNPYESAEQRAAKDLVYEVRLTAMPATVGEALDQARAYVAPPDGPDTPMRAAEV